ncbi:DarT1-associated NADAR antitoxin family protein [Providencia stuartii]|uniref:DarT1-associated NADAR antitoxin family protein n=1 Tax=Providencia stuartii TaxID=588 RepID=UPI0024AC57F7|nr:hypothetical protein [Providencia stuartii]MCX3072505.1 hypothetical protein [Providencia stuartii]
MNKSIGVATRPIFIPSKCNVGVKELNIEFDWHLGMSPEVRKRSVLSLHEKARSHGFINILEASSKSEQKIGLLLSAFFLKNISGYPVENIFQSSKVFSNGGPYRDLLSVSPRNAKKDERLKNSGEMVGFTLNKKDYPLEPKSIFYDWLYMQVLFSEVNDKLREEFFSYNFDAFSDIEFNPKKSFSCQARTLALALSLSYNNKVSEFISDPVEFNYQYDIYKKELFQEELF